VRWLGLAHGCRVGAGKHYWHTFYSVDWNGTLLEISEPFKLAPSVGIEFAAGMAHDPQTDRLAISYGIEDDSAHVGVTTLSAALATLRPVAAGAASSPSSSLSSPGSSGQVTPMLAPATHDGAIKLTRP